MTDGMPTGLAARHEALLYDEEHGIFNVLSYAAPYIDFVRNGGVRQTGLLASISTYLDKETKIVSALDFACALFAYRLRENRIWLMELDKDFAEVQAMCPPLFVSRGYGQPATCVGYEFPDDDERLFELFLRSKATADAIVKRMAWNLEKGTPLSRSAQNLCSMVLKNDSLMPKPIQARPDETHRDILFAVAAKRICDVTRFPRGASVTTFQSGEARPICAASIVSAAWESFGNKMSPKRMAKILDNSKALLDLAGQFESLAGLPPKPSANLQSALALMGETPIPERVQSAIRILTSTL